MASTNAERNQEPIDDLVAIRGIVDLTDPEQRAAIVGAIVKLAYCRDTMAILEEKLHGGRHREVRNSFNAERED